MFDYFARVTASQQRLGNVQGISHSTEDLMVRPVRRVRGEKQAHLADQRGQFEDGFIQFRD